MDVFYTLQKGNVLSSSHSLSSMAPNLDPDGVLRVGGRLLKAQLSMDMTRPVLLSVKSHITQLLIQSIHATALHAGPSTVMAMMAQTYHIPSLKKYLKMLSRHCVLCQRAYARTAKQMMGELPEARVKFDKPFSVLGIDFAGPFSYKEGNLRKPTIMKGYAVYVCFITKAEYFDLVADMSSEAFMASLRRFTSIYDTPHDIHTDNGTNFTGANAVLKKPIKLLSSDSDSVQIQLKSSYIAGLLARVYHGISA